MRNGLALCERENRRVGRLSHRIDVVRPERLERARREGRKTVALIGIDLPEELFWACGAVPISVGSFATPTAADEALPRDACAVVRTGFDLLAHHWIPAGLIDAVVAASGCDWAARLGDRLEGRVPVWVLNTSRAAATSDPAALVHSRRASLAAMLKALEVLTDMPLTRKAFDAAHQRMTSLRGLCDRLNRLRATIPPTVCASEYYATAGALDLADPARWAAAAEAFLADARMPQQTGSADPRVILSGCPAGFPDTSIVDLIEEAGLDIVGDDFTFHGDGRWIQSPPRGGRRAILDGLADALVCDGAGDLPMKRGQRQANSLSCDGIIRLHYRGCAVGAMELTWLSPAFSDRGEKVLEIEVEQIGAAPEATRTRLEAFRERLTARDAGCQPVKTL